MPLKTHTVKAGDTVGQIAENYGVDISAVTGYKSGDANKIGVGENLSINTPDAPPVNRINAADLGQSPLVPPPTSVPTGAVSLQSLAEGTKTKIEGLQTEVDTDEKEIRSQYTKLGQQASKRAEAYKSEETAFGTVNETSKELTDINNRIRQKETAYNRKIERIQSENPTGQLSEGQKIAIEKADREWAREAADLSIIAEVKLGNYDGAKGIIDDKIDAETEDLTTQLKGLEFFYSKNYNRLTEAQRTQIQQDTNIVKDQLTEKRDRLKEIGAIQLDAANNGASADVIMSIGKSEDIEGAIVAAGQYLDTRKPGDSGPGGQDGIIDIQPEDERTLTGAGFTTEDITDIQKGVRDFGVEAVIANLTNEAQKAAVRKVYNVQQRTTRAQIEEEATLKNTLDYYKKNFTSDEIITMARNNGFKRFWSGKTAEAKLFLKSPAAKALYVDKLVADKKGEGAFQE